MKRNPLLLAAMIAGVVWACEDGVAQLPPPRDPDEVYQHQPPPVVEPGYTWVREVRYKDVQHPVCKRVPDKKYKWVYDTRPDYYCIPPCPIHLFRKSDCDDGQGCPNCNGPFYRPQLKKMQVEIVCGTKCVVEYVKASAPYVVWRKVRIGAEAEKGTLPHPVPTPTPIPPARQSGWGEPGPRVRPFGLILQDGTR